MSSALNNSGRVLVFPVLIIIFAHQNAGTHVEFNNIKCISLDKAFADFEYCYIKAINRTYKYFSLKLNFLKVPVSNVTIRVQLKRRSNGYIPFLLDTTINGCKFMKDHSSPLHTFFYSIIIKHTNLNHSCPYHHPVIVDKMDVNFMNNKLTELVPASQGDYACITTFSTYNKERGSVHVFLKLNIF